MDDQNMKVSAPSIVIPTYNGAKFVGTALESVFAQTLPPHEILVIDDGSTDGTPRVVHEYARKSPVPFHLTCLSRNSGGPARPLNLGIQRAAGKYVSVLEQDDIFVPDRLERMVRVLEGHPEVVLVFSECGRFGDPDKYGSDCQLPQHLRHFMEVSVPIEGHWLTAAEVTTCLLLAHGNFIVGYPGFMFRRVHWQEKGGLDESLRIASDYDLLCWLGLRGPVIFLPEKLYLRRMHENNLSAARLPASMEVARVINRYLGKRPVLAGHPYFRDSFADHFLWLVNSLEFTGREWRAISILWSFARGRPWEPGYRNSVMGLVGTGVRQMMGRRALRVRFQELEEFADGLNAIAKVCRRHFNAATRPHHHKHAGRD
jgi:glycosyltransferase involved in cell wall biosynthesis